MTIIDYYWPFVSVLCRCDLGRQQNNASWFSWDGAFNGQHQLSPGQNRTISHCTSGSPHGKVTASSSLNGGVPKWVPRIIQIGSFQYWNSCLLSKWSVRVAISPWFSLSSLDSLGCCAGIAHFRHCAGDTTRWLIVHCRTLVVSHTPDHSTHIRHPQPSIRLRSRWKSGHRWSALSSRHLHCRSQESCRSIWFDWVRVILTMVTRLISSFSML